MPTPTTHTDPSRPGPTLHVALDLGNTSWCLAGAPAVAAPARVRMFPARSLARLHAELASARQHFGLPADAPIVLCYEAGRDGFWLQRACTAAGIVALVVDSSSIEVSRRARRAKTDRLDATALLRLLFRHTAGERAHWRVLHVPTMEEEDRRQVHRELARLTQERTRAVNRIKGLLAAHGLRLTTLRALPDRLPHLTQWDHTPLPPGVCERVQINWARLTLIQAQRTTVVRARRALLETASDPATQMVRRLLQLRGVGEVSAWLLTMELFSWRRFRNRREVAGVLGLTATPQASGDRRRELGIGKGGSALLRGLAMELAWGVAPLPAGECLESMVPGAVRGGRVASAADRDRRASAPAHDCALALRRNGPGAGRSDDESLTPPHKLLREGEWWHCTRHRSGSSR